MDRPTRDSPDGRTGQDGVEEGVDEDDQAFA